MTAVGPNGTVHPMKRRFLVGSVVFLLVACGPVKEPKQANQPDPTDEQSGDDSSSSSSGSKKNNDIFVPPPGGGGGSADNGKPVKGAKGEAPVVGSLASFQDGLRWGMSHAEVTKTFSENGGIIWKDYDDKLKKARIGPEQTAIEAERERKKQGFARSFIEFKDTPTGYDATGIKGEFTYKNRESLMWIEREGKPKRYFFFINDRLWKIYDEVPLADSGEYGKSYLDAVNTMNGKLGAQGRILGVDPAKGITSTTVDYKDASNHLRLVDRSGEKVVGLVIEDGNTLANLASLRSVKADDPNAIDPTVAAVTKGGLSDPNAPSAAPSASGKGAGKKPPKKK
jgi:hypothetical protein